MSMSKKDPDFEKVPFEAALDKAGFGTYSYLMVCLTGVTIISFACIAYGTPIIVPTSACELETTSSQQGLLASGPIVGSMLGGMVWGYLADTRGRKPMLIWSLLGAAVLNALASLSVHWVMLLIVQLFATLFASGLYSMSMSLLSESVPMAKRNLVVLLVSSIFMLSQGVTAALAIPVIPLTFSYHLPALGIYWNSWRTLMVLYSIPCLISALWLYFMQESPKFLFTKGDEVASLNAIRTIHRINNFRSKEEFEVLGLFMEETKSKEETDSSAKDQMSTLFKAPLLKYTIIMTLLFTFQQLGAFMVWFPTIADQLVRVLESGDGTDLTVCGVLDSAQNLPPNEDAVPCALNETSLLLVLAVGGLQSLVNIIISTFINKAGRRNVVIGVAAICGVSGILVNLVPNVIGSTVLFIILLMGIVVLGIYTAIMVSLFPTNVRVFAIAFGMSFGRLGTFASIQILNALLESNCEVGYYIFASLFASSAIVSSFLPDDRRAKAVNSTPPSNKPDDNEHDKTTTQL